MRHVADAATGLGRRATQIVAGHFESSPGSRQQAAQHAKGGGFASAVRAQQAEDLAPPHLEADVLDRVKLAETTLDPIHPDDRRVIVGHGRRHGQRKRFPRGCVVLPL